MINQNQFKQQEEKKFTFTFNINQINLIMAGLDELPHKFSRNMIDEMQKQIQAQQVLQ